LAPDVIFHASAGGIAMLSGAVALFSRKGGRLHRTAGTVFFISMLINAASASYLGFARSQIGDIVGGLLTIYLIATAWMTVRRAEGETGLVELGAFLFATAGAAIGFFGAVQSVQNGTALLGGIPAFGFSSVVALAAALDLSVILRRGVSGRQRIARHLWRMHLGLFVAVGSFFPGQLQLFPEFIQQIRPIILLFIPAFLIIGLMIFWLIRVLFTNWYRKAEIAPSRAPSQPAKALP
jgi:uncharacterized membrane protein